MVSRFKWWFVLGVLAAAVLSVGTALATPGSGVTSTLFGRATFDPFNIIQVRSNQEPDAFVILSTNETDVVMRKTEIAVGGHSGWHTHPGPTFVIVTQGRLELTRAEDCEPHVFGPGEEKESFVKIGNDVHIERNAGKVPVVAYVTQLNVPVGGAFTDSTVDFPADCDVPFD
jgi:hypothetical protein